MDTNWNTNLPNTNKMAASTVAGSTYTNQTYTAVGPKIKGGWHHLAMVKDSIAGSLVMYLDGDPCNLVTGMTEAIPDSNQCFIGSSVSAGRIWNGALDDFRVYNRPLTRQEILWIIDDNAPKTAYNPNPISNATFVDPCVVLGWIGGSTADTHNIYFGTNFNDVNTATPDGYAADISPDGKIDLKDVQVMAAQWLATSGTADLNHDSRVNFADFALLAQNYGKTATFKGTISSNITSYAPGALQFGQTYYWRVDEVENGGPIWKGAVWSFTVAPGALISGVSIETNHLKYDISPTGDNSSFKDKSTNTEYLSASKCASLKMDDGTVHAPITAYTLPLTNQIALIFDTGIVVLYDVSTASDYFTLKVNSINTPDVNEITFVNIPVYNLGTPADTFPTCALALNLQTNITDMPGSSKHLIAKCYKKLGLVGAKAAIIGCPKASLRSIMKTVVTNASVTDLLPKSSFGGPWALDDPNTAGSYIFDDVGVTATTASNWITLCNQIGVKKINLCVNVSHAFRYGDYLPNSTIYPAGFTSVNAMTTALHNGGIKIGLHTMAFYIDPACTWVSSGDSRLLSNKMVTLRLAVGASDTTIPLNGNMSDVNAFTGYLAGATNNTVRIGTELINYTGVTTTVPYSLTGCTRGAFGSTAASHSAGASSYHVVRDNVGMFVPDPNTSLFTEVAQKTADAINLGGFDMLYMDGLNGAGILAGDSWAWHYGPKFMFEVVKRLNHDVIIDASTLNHHLWYTRSRMGTWDVSFRGHKEFIDRHVLCNETSTYPLGGGSDLNMFIPGHLGWFIPVAFNASFPQNDVTFPDVFEYLCSQCMGHNSSLSLSYMYPGSMTAFSTRLAAVVKKWETLRVSNYFPQAIIDQLKTPGNEFTLKLNSGTGAWQLYPIQYSKNKVFRIDGTSNVWSTTNKFSSQPLRLRIEALQGTTANSYASGTVVASFTNPAVDFINDANAEHVTSSLTSVATPAGGPSDPVSGQFSATNSTAVKTAAWARKGKVFSTVQDLSGKALGVWIYGDNKGEVLNIQVMDSAASTTAGVFANWGIIDHYVDINFSGWKYFELIESDAARHWKYTWDYGWEYAIHFLNYDSSITKYINLYFNNIAPGDTVTCKISPIKAVPLSTITLTSPAVTIGSNTITFPNMTSGQYIEFDNAADCNLYNSDGSLSGHATTTGTQPTLSAGNNTVTFSSGVSGGANARARVTVISQAADSLKTDIAFNPAPANGTINVYPHQTLSWTAGMGAVNHDVYIGTNLTSVTNATTSTPGIYMGRQAGTLYKPAVAFPTTGVVYYWRVDEVNGVTIKKGDVWSLTTTSTSIHTPTSLWPLNEGTGTTFHDTIQNRTAPLYSSTPIGHGWVAGKTSTWAYNFNAQVAVYQSGGYALPGSTSRQQTVAFWFKGNPTIVNGPSYPIANFYAGVASTGAVYNYIDTSWNSTPSIFALTSTTVAGSSYADQAYMVIGAKISDGWHHVAMTKDGGAIKIYLDGVLQGTGPSTTSITAAAKVFIGGTVYGSSCFNGAMNDFRVYNNTAIPVEEINDIYQQGL